MSALAFWLRDQIREVSPSPARQLALIGRVEAAVAAEAEGVARISSMDGAPISPRPTAIGERCRPDSRFRDFAQVIGGLQAKGFFARKLAVGLQCP